MKKMDGIVIGFFVVALLILAAGMIFNKGITGYVVANQTSCPGALASNIYVLTKDIYYSINPSTTGNVVYNLSASPACIKVTQPDTIINCNGHGIYNNLGGQITGIYSNKQNTSISNCKINVGSAGTGIVLENQSSVSGSTIYGNSIGVHIKNSAGAVISDNDIRNNDQGIASAGSSLEVSKNNLTNNNHGLISSSDIILQISFNFVSNNVNDGIFLLNPISGDVKNNTITYNKGRGVNVRFSDATLGGSTIYGNYLNYNGIGINLFGTGSGSNYVGFNTIYGSDSSGISLISTNNNNVIANNVILSKGNGIYLTGSSGNKLEQNTLSGNQVYGVVLENSNNNNILNNTAESNKNYGFYITSGTGNSVTGNKANLNNDGFVLNEAVYTTLSDNSAQGNSEKGYYLYGSSNNLLTRNKALNNQYGIYLDYGSNANNINNNTLSGNSAGDSVFVDSTSFGNLVTESSTTVPPTGIALTTPTTPPSPNDGSPEDNAFVSVPGSVPITHRPSSSELGSGYLKYLKANDRIEFNLLGATHSVRLQSVSSSGATVVVSSDPITIGLQVQESKKVNLENDNFYDLVVKLESVRNSNEAQIYVKSIREFAPGSSLRSQEDLGEVGAGFIENEGTSGNTTKYLFIIAIIVLLVAAVIIVFLTVNKSREQKRIGGMPTSNFPRPVGWKVD